MYSVSGTMAHIRCEVELDDRTFKIKLSQDCTVSQLMIKIRAYLKLKPEQAYYLFFEQKGLIYNTERLYTNSKTLGEVKTASGLETQKIRLLRDSTFGTWTRSFVKARIEERKGIYVSILTFSYLGLYHFDEVACHNSLAEAQEHMLKERCNGCLSLVQPAHK